MDQKQILGLVTAATAIAVAVLLWRTDQPEDAGVPVERPLEVTPVATAAAMNRPVLLRCQNCGTGVHSLTDMWSLQIPQDVVAYARSLSSHMAANR